MAKWFDQRFGFGSEEGEPWLDSLNDALGPNIEEILGCIVEDLKSSGSLGIKFSDAKLDKLKHQLGEEINQLRNSEFSPSLNYRIVGDLIALTMGLESVPMKYLKEYQTALKKRGLEPDRGFVF